MPIFSYQFPALNVLIGVLKIDRLEIFKEALNVKITCLFYLNLLLFFGEEEILVTSITQNSSRIKKIIKRISSILSIFRVALPDFSLNILINWVLIKNKTCDCIDLMIGLTEKTVWKNSGKTQNQLPRGQRCSKTGPNFVVFGSLVDKMWSKTAKSSKNSIL